ncbi:MAG: Uma2 family endonuclease [Cyanobacteria bacterium P01_G01_bin.39]
MVAINFGSIISGITDIELERLSADNPDLKFETNRLGHLIAMSPTGSESGRLNMNLAAQVWNWNAKTKLGLVYDSSTGFKLSNGAIRSPDVTWIAIERWNELTSTQQKKFAPIDPDFVIELMSPTDDLTQLQVKMTEYINCGVKLGWLINPEDKQVEIYRNAQDKEVLYNPQSLSGENVLPNLVVDLADIF